jgi:hypothetical protein
LNEIAHKNLFCSFGYGFDRDSSCFQQLFVPFNIFSLFFVFSLKFSLRAADHFPNRIQREFLFNDAIQSQRGVLSLCAAEKPCSSLKPSAPKNKPSQTRPASLARSRKRRACHFAPPRATCVTCVVKRRCACHFALPTLVTNGAS